MDRCPTICILILFGTVSAIALPTPYTDEASYLAALSGYSTITEGFEGSDWDLTRTPSSVSTLTTQDITWSAIGLATEDVWVRSGSWGVHDGDGCPEVIAVSGTVPVTGVGGWFVSNTGCAVNFEIDSQVVATLDLGVRSGHQFLGIVDPSGFSSIAFTTPDGHWWADDFTIAANPIPSPGAVLLGSIGISIVGWFRKRKAL